jgi:TetR/AcrR family fatty acid metabolism transcriptional regulator
MTDRSFSTARPREPHDPDKRRRLVEAAARAFARSGFDRASVDDIARDAGVAKGTTYLYFPSKRALFLAALDELRQRLGTLPDAARDGAPAQRLRAFVRLHLDVARQAPDLFRCYTSALFGVNRDFQEAALRGFAWEPDRAAEAMRPRRARRTASGERRAELVAAATLAASLMSGLTHARPRDSALEEDVVLHGALGRQR